MRSRHFRLVGGAAVCLGAAGALLVATDVVGRVARWDVSAFLGLRVLSDHPQIDGLGHRVVHLADPLPTVAMLAAICLAGLLWGRPRHAGAAALLVGGAALTGLAMKLALAHPRYQALLGSQSLAPETFPSGHATTAMSIGLAAVLVTPRRWRLPVAIIAAGYALAAGVSVVIIGWHYPSDVLGAFLVSGAFGLLAIAALRATDARSEDQRPARWPFGEPRRAIESPLMALGGGAIVIALAVAVSRAGELMSYAAANTTAVVATMGIALVAAALVYGIAAELDQR